IIDNKVVPNVQKNGDKYTRQTWDSVAPCIHTRNDIMASQNTVHPNDDREFSLRELMLMMKLHKSFSWSDMSEEKLNNLPLVVKKKYLKAHEINTRQNIEEAVPTIIMQKIRKNIIGSLDVCVKEKTATKVHKKPHLTA